MAETRLALAEISIEERRLAEAERLANQAGEEFHKESETDLEAAAHAVAARALLVEGRPEEARTEADRAIGILQHSEDREARLFVAIDVSRVHAANGLSEEAIRELRSAIAEARQYGYVGYAFKSRLALAEVELKSGRIAEARAVLAALAKHAQVKGFGLIARKAAVDLAATTRPR